MPQANPPLLEQLVEYWPLPRWHDVTVLLAVSGGADSMALLRAVPSAKHSGDGRLIVAHFNHHLRGDDSDADQQFVIDQSQRLGLDCWVGHDESLPTTQSPEEEARRRRYDFLRKTAEQTGARYVVVAHTADDQAETILHHILRGTGLAGLAGMPRTRPLGPATTLVRPLLQTTRAEVLEYLNFVQQPFREDRTNAERHFTRNRIRHDLLPLLSRDYSPTVVQSLLRLGSLAADSQRVIDTLACESLDRAMVEQTKSSVTLRCEVLRQQDRHLVREACVALWRRQEWPLQAMRFEHWDSLAELAIAPAQPKTDASSRQKMFPGAVRAERHDDVLTLTVERV